METTPSPAPGLARYSNHRTLEMLTHVLYRDVFLTLHPKSPLPAAFAQRLSSTHHYGPKRRTTDQEFIEHIRRVLKTMRDENDSFCAENIHVCLNVAILLHKLENLKDFEKDMKPRYEYRLSCVNLLQSWDRDKEEGVWVLDWREGFGEGLKDKPGGPASESESDKEARELERIVKAGLEEDD